ERRGGNAVADRLRIHKSQRESEVVPHETRGGAVLKGQGQDHLALVTYHLALVTFRLVAHGNLDQVGDVLVRFVDEEPPADSHGQNGQRYRRQQPIPPRLERGERRFRFLEVDTDETTDDADPEGQCLRDLGTLGAHDEQQDRKNTRR